MALAHELAPPTPPPGRNAPKDARELFLPVPGRLYFDVTGDNPRPYDNYDLHIGTYATRRAMHRTGIYRPHDFDPNESPVVIMGVPWLVGNRGHIHNVADEWASDGVGVVVKGTPRYYGPQTDALTFAEDANELHGLVRQVERTDLLGKLGTLRWYGESQAAGKAYVGLAISPLYDRDVVDGLAVAPCPDEPITIWNAHRFLPQLLTEGVDLARIGHRIGWSGIMKLRGTFSLKDAHHHAAVPPVLASGEPGEVVPYIPPLQPWDVVFGALDRQSRPATASKRLEGTLPGVRTQILPGLGHLATIKSDEVTQMRHELVQT